MIIWVIFWAIDKTSSMKPRVILPWIRRLRWVTWISAMVLFFGAFLVDHFLVFPRYAIALSTFSIGMAMPEGWLKRKIVPSTRTKPEYKNYRASMVFLFPIP
jgi:hypothetical protein